MIAVVAAAFVLAAPSPAKDAGPAPRELEARAVTLPGEPPISMDYLAVDLATGVVWVPAGSSGRIDLYDPAQRNVRAIEGVKTEKRGERVAGPTAVSLGEGHAWVGNRADSSLCAYTTRAGAKEGCVTFPSTPDGVAFVAPTREVWVTTPRDQTLRVVDVKQPAAPRLAGDVKLTGAPEGYAVDAKGGVFYTNLEDKDRTVGVSLRTRAVVSDWPAGCGEAGPRGLAWDGAHGRLLRACTDRLQVVEAKTGTILSELPVGGGVDNIDWLAEKELAFVASGRAGRVTVARVDAKGRLHAVAQAKVAEGCRTVVAGKDGASYAPDSRGGRLWVIAAP